MIRLDAASPSRSKCLAGLLAPRLREPGRVLNDRLRKNPVVQLRKSLKIRSDLLQLAFGRLQHEDQGPGRISVRHRHQEAHAVGGLVHGERQDLRLRQTEWHIGRKPEAFNPLALIVGHHLPRRLHRCSEGAVNDPGCPCSTFGASHNHHLTIPARRQSGESGAEAPEGFGNLPHRARHRSRSIVRLAPGSDPSCPTPAAPGECRAWGGHLEHAPDLDIGDLCGAPPSDQERRAGGTSSRAAFDRPVNDQRLHPLTMERNGVGNLEKFFQEIPKPGAPDDSGRFR